VDVKISTYCIMSKKIELSLNVGDKVELEGKGNRVGIIRFIGHVHFKTGVLYGIELTDGSIGSNDGSVGKDRYFKCRAKSNRGERWKPEKKQTEKPALRGVFVRRFKIRRILRKARTIPSLSRARSTPKAKSPTKPSTSRSKSNPKASRGSRRTNVMDEKTSLIERKGRMRRAQKRPCKICGVDLNFSEPLADKVMEHVVLGGFAQSQDGDGLMECAVTHVLNCARELPNCFPGTLKYLKLDLRDSSSERLKGVFEKSFAFLDECQKMGGVCLVHCQQGKSRSASILCAYLIARRGLSMDAALKRLQDARPIVQPNESFMRQLRDFEHMAKIWREKPDPKRKVLYGYQSYTQRKEVRDRRDSWSCLPDTPGVKDNLSSTGRRLSAPERIELKLEELEEKHQSPRRRRGSPEPARGRDCRAALGVRNLNVNSRNLKSQKPDNSSSKSRYGSSNVSNRKSRPTGRSAFSPPTSRAGKITMRSSHCSASSSAGKITYRSARSQPKPVMNFVRLKQTIDVFV